MSRNGSGTYSLPVNSWNPATNGASATANDWQQLINDVASAMTQSLSADGQTPVTGNLQMSGNRLTGLGAGSATGQSVRWEQLFSQGVEADIPSAATVDIGIQNTNFLRITGTTTITSLGTNYNGPRFLRFAAALVLTHNATSLILPNSANITTGAGDLAIAIPKGTADGWFIFFQRASYATQRNDLGAVGSADLQTNVFTGFTTAGTSTAYTLTPSPAITSYAARTAFDVTFHTASGASPTLQISGLASPPNLVRQIAAGTYQNIAANEIPASHFSEVVLLSATQALVVTMPPATTTTSPPKRQTVYSGPVDSNGMSNFGGSTGSTTVTMSGTLVLSAANGTADRIGTITNASWTGLSTNGTRYLFLEIDASGNCTTLNSGLEPTYRPAGADVVTNGQHTFNWQEMQMKVGNGSTASQVWRVCVGQVTVAGSVVTAITWYSLNNRAYRTQASLAVGTQYVFTTNIGIPWQKNRAYLRCNTAEFNFRVGDMLEVGNSATNGSGSWFGSQFSWGTNDATVMTNTSAIGSGNRNLGNYATSLFTPANWSLVVDCERNF